MIKINIDSNRTNDIRKNDKFAGILVLKLNLVYSKLLSTFFSIKEIKKIEIVTVKPPPIT